MAPLRTDHRATNPEAQRKPRTLAQIIKAWVRNQNGESICDACIAHEIGMHEIDVVIASCGVV